jgi:acetylglutamate kinase
MALSYVNVRIVAALNHAGLASVGLSGVDASVLHATSLGAPWDRAGSSPIVDVRALESMWRSGFTPVLSSVAVDVEGGLLNCNADTVAGAVAGATSASSLVLLSDIDQLRADVDDVTSALSSVTMDQVRAMIDGGTAREGMRPKMAAALDALVGGAERIVMANGTRRHALRDALSFAIPTTEVVR